jgi:hypothetical protein
MDAQKIVEGVHKMDKEIITGTHVQWFGLPVIGAIQAENLQFILSGTGGHIFEE